jgi:hypothetical protein
LISLKKPGEQIFTGKRRTSYIEHAIGAAGIGSFQ